MPDLARSQLEKRINGLPPQTFDKNAHLSSLISLIRDADSGELLERIMLAGLSQRAVDLINRNFPEFLDQTENIGLPGRAHEFLIGLIVEHGGSGTTSTTYEELAQQFARVHDAFLLNEIALYASGGQSIQELQLQKSLLHREFTAGRFREEEQYLPAARRSYRPFDDEMEEYFSFTIDDAIDVAGYLAMQLERTILEHLKMEPLVELAQDIPADSPSSWFQQMANSDRLQASAQGINNIYGDIDETGFLWFEPSKHVARLPEPLDTGTFLNVISELRINVGDTSSIPRGEFRSPVDGPNPIDVRPLVELNGRIMPSSGSAILEALIETFYYRVYNSMKHDGRKKEFEKRWGASLEDWTVDVLADLFEDGHILPGPKYSGGESDVIIPFEDTLLVIECKTKKLPVETRTGNFPVLSEHTEKGIGKALDQANRTIKRIVKDGELEIEMTDGNTSTLYSSNYDNYHPIIVLRDTYDNIATTDYRQLLTDHDIHPYVLDIFTLEILVNIFGTSGELINYITVRREEMRTGQFYSMDEIDYLAHYLTNERSFDQMDSPNPLQLPNMTDYIRQQLSDDFGTDPEKEWRHYL